MTEIRIKQTTMTSSGHPGPEFDAQDKELLAELEHHRAPPPPPTQPATAVILTADDVGVSYGDFLAVSGVNLGFIRHEITALIGPSGCGKSSMLRCLNRMNDLVPGAKVHGEIRLHGTDIYDPSVDVIRLRRHVGMVFQAPNPFPKSIYDNIAYGPRVTGMKVGDLDEVVERALKAAALWDEVKDKLKRDATGLSGGQQQRLCIARAIAINPEVILMDEPCSALDPIATAKIEDLMFDLAQRFTIIIVTHNMQQAARVSHRTAFFTAEADEQGKRLGKMVEFDTTDKIFSNPTDPRTEAYISGRFG